MTDNRPPVYNGRYELQSQVARGGTAQVYLARDIILGRPVALKVLFPELSTDSAFVERFRREAQAAASLSHPNIVPVYDWGESDDTYFIVMEYVDGEPLSSIIHTQAPVNPASAAQVAADIAKALTYAHRHGVVHRDVKPGNVLITADGQVKVTDFGIARAVGNLDDQVTQTGLVMGTATYFSPEQAQGLDVDGRSDIYSLGVVLYEMLVGRPPFIGDTPVAIAYQHVQETPPRPRALNPEIPVALEAIVLQAMAKLPAERYQSADDLRADLERFLRNQTVLATPPSEFAPGPLTEALPRSAPPEPVAAASTEPVVAQDDLAIKEPTTMPYWIVAAVVLLIATVLVGIAGGRSLGYFGGARYVKIPYLVGKTATAATTQLKNAGLVPRVDPVANSNQAKVGIVFSTVPGDNQTVKTGALVMLKVGGKVALETVPSVIGQSLKAAKAALTKAHLNPVVSTVPYTLNAKIGYVTEQSAVGGTQQLLGSSITITVVGTPTKAIVPTFTANETAQQAGAALGAKGFQVSSTSKPVFNSTVPAGDVIRSIPPSGTSLPQGSVVELVTSRGPAISVPNLIGSNPSDAEATLTALGLTLSVSTTQQPETNPAFSGVIVLQDPSAGSKLAAGNAVTVETGVYIGGTTGTGATTTTTTTLPLTTVSSTTPTSFPTSQ
jgi:beta-lactam-binding protein with PASTA domain/predicted Ser/Thr protein kinase